MITGAGFLVDAYDIFVIGMVISLVYEVYYPGQDGNLSDFKKKHLFVDGLMKSITHMGNMVGQLLFGCLADKFGRKQVYGLEMIIVLVSTIGSALSSSAIRGVDVLTVLAFWRFALGIGMGGDYPQSATIAAERAGKNKRGMMVSAVFSMQGIGLLVGSIVAVITLVIFKQAIQRDSLNLDYVWRIALGIPAIPSAILLYYRFTLPETKIFEDDQKKITDVHYCESTASGFHSRNFFKWVSHPTNAKHLFATAYTWFALDVAWYGLTLNQGTILTAIGFGKGVDIYDHYYLIALGGLAIVMMGTVPGYFVTVATIERLGRKPIQFLGFAVITLILMILAIFWEFMLNNKIVFVILFGISQFFFNFGPNVTTFVIPAELFPTRFRSTCHGISAASGKLGAIVGTLLVAPFYTNNERVVLLVFAFVMASGFMATFLLPETKGLDLHDDN
jgi:PHS family inorganic phosphate transporter-like MFS transporter